MLKTGTTLNAQLARVYSEIGHTDTIVVTDAGLPIPQQVERVDLAVKQNLPRFLELLDVTLASVAVEGALLRDEVKTASPELLQAVKERLDPLGVEIKIMPHVDFKKETHKCRAAIRSGEFTSYANVILTCGVVY